MSQRAFEENRQLASRNAALEDRTEAAETALAEANRRSYDNWKLAQAAERRANDLADALREIGDQARTDGELYAAQACRAALDRIVAPGSSTTSTQSEALPEGNDGNPGAAIQPPESPCSVCGSYGHFTHRHTQEGAP